MEILPNPQPPARGFSIERGIFFIFKHSYKNGAQIACFQTLERKPENKPLVLKHLKESKSRVGRTHQLPTPPSSFFVFMHLCKNGTQAACFQTLAPKQNIKSFVLRHL